MDGSNFLDCGNSSAETRFIHRCLNVSKAIRIMLVEDHFSVRAALNASLCCESDLSVVAESDGSEDVLDVYRRHQPDITLMDLRLPKLDGLQLTAAIRREFPQARVIVYSMFDSPGNVRDASSAGAVAFLSKHVERGSLLQAIRSAFNQSTAQ
jgi:DNA-binding NarL/FixJ family response regulator